MFRCASFVFLLISIASSAQTRSQYQFAHSYLGLEYEQVFPIEQNSLNLPSFIIPRIEIGASHFWNKADFYVSFPLASIPLSRSNAKFNTGVVTGARVLPFGLMRNKPSMYAGVYWNVPSFKWASGELLTRSSVGLELGFNTLIKSSLSLELGMRANLRNSWSYYSERNLAEDIKTAPFSLTVGLKKYLDFTAYLDHPSSQKHVTTVLKTLEESNRLSGFAVGLGISSAIATTPWKQLKPYSFLNTKTGMTIHQDLGVSYYFHPLDASVRLSYFKMKFKSAAHGLQYQYAENKYVLDGYKFLLNYNGFVPFLGFGACISQNKYQIEDFNSSIEDQSIHWEGIISAGWDIRPTQVEWFILRTNIRYHIPLNSIQNTATFQKLDIGFIQWVVYPQRIKAHFKK